MRWLLMCLLLAACSSTSTTSPTAVPEASIAAVTTTVARVALSAETSSEATTSTEPVADGIAVPTGFDSTLARVTDAGGATCEICVWLAEASADRARGLMNVTDMGAADAMVFLYPDPHTGSFWMKNTMMPLSIAFFAPNGGFVQAFDMEPCVTEQCLSYPTPADFLIALEVPQGRLPDFGIAPGSTLELLDLPCDET